MGTTLDAIVEVREPGHQSWWRAAKWSLGKVYDIMDGTITADDGAKYSGYISAEDARHAGRTIGEAPFPGSDATHNPDNEFIPFVEA